MYVFDLSRVILTQILALHVSPSVKELSKNESLWWKNAHT